MAGTELRRKLLLASVDTLRHVLALRGECTRLRAGHGVDAVLQEVRDSTIDNRICCR